MSHEPTIGIASVFAIWVATYSIMAQEHQLSIASLEGKWTLVEVRGRTIEPGTNIFFEINSGKISGFDGCNNFGGLLEKPELIRKGQRACEGNEFSLPLDLRNPISQLLKSSMEGEELKLSLEDGNTAVLRRNTLK